MKFSVNQQDLQQALSYCQGVIEKRSTLQILSNIMLNVENSKLTITATDLDLIFIHKINNIEVAEEGKTTTTSSIMYDIIRKISSGNKINLTLNDKKENFRRIIDIKNNSGWIHVSQLTKVNSIIPLKDKILFKKPSEFSMPIAKIKEGRILNIQKCLEKWCKVKTESLKGWIKNNSLWGNTN